MAGTYMRHALKWAAGAVGVAAGAYASYVGVTWLRYGHPAPARADASDPLLDRFMPVYDVAERHHVHVTAPAEIATTTRIEHGVRSHGAVRGCTLRRTFATRISSTRM